MQQQDNKQQLAVFDFDKTMTDRHSFWRFLRYCAGHFKFYFAPFLFPKDIMRFYRKEITLMEFREIAIKYFFLGMDKSNFMNKATKFSKEKIPGWIVTEALEKVKEHQEKGHKVALVSNAAQEYLTPWATYLGFDYIIGSRFDIESNKLTGKLIGDHCYGAEKVKRLQLEVGQLENYELYVYGDSEGDKELLEKATHPYYRSFTKQGVYTK